MAGQLTVKATQDDGFSLIELLIVIAVLSILAVSLSLTVGRTRQAAHVDASKFLQQAHLQRSLAVQGRGLRGLVISPQGMQVAEYRGQSQGWKIGATELRWSGRAALLSHPPRSGLGVPGRQPDILFRPDGGVSEFDIRFSSRQAGMVLCRARNWADVSCDEL